MKWIYDPDPDNQTYMMNFTLMLQDREVDVTVEQDRHLLGLFSRDQWAEQIQSTAA